MSSKMRSDVPDGEILIFHIWIRKKIVVNGRRLASSSKKNTASRIAKDAISAAMRMTMIHFQDAAVFLKSIRKVFLKE